VDGFVDGVMAALIMPKTRRKTWILSPLPPISEEKVSRNRSRGSLVKETMTTYEVVPEEPRRVSFNVAAATIIFANQLLLILVCRYAYERNLSSRGAIANVSTLVRASFTAVRDSSLK